MADIRALEDLEQLAEIISSNAKKVKGFYTNSHIPPPSFDKDSPLSFPDAAPLDIHEARRNILDASSKINQLAKGPIDHLIWFSASYADTGCLRYACHYNIPATIPLDGQISYTELALQTKTPETHTRRVLRYLMTSNIFQEPQPGHVAHTVGSKLLVIPGLGDMAAYASIDGLPMAANLVEAVEKYGPSEEPNETAFNIASGSSLPVFREWANDPIKGPRFARAMTALQSTPAYGMNHVLSGYNWEGLSPDCTIVDIGGSVGQVATAIANHTPQNGPKFIVQDLEGTILPAKSKPLPAELEGRIEFQPHDFFTPEPVKHADVYFMRFILHDYSDTYALKILQNIIPAMKPKHSKLVIMDQIMPPTGGETPTGTISASVERMLRFMDIQMMIMLNAKEREMGEWMELFGKASGGKLKLMGVKVPEGSAMAVLELELME